MQDEWRTGLNYNEYLVVPFGFTNAPAVFQTLLKVLRGMLYNIEMDPVNIEVDE